jgi:hypothetical protein
MELHTLIRALCAASVHFLDQNASSKRCGHLCLPRLAEITFVAGCEERGPGPGTDPQNQLATHRKKEALQNRVLSETPAKNLIHAAHRRFYRR